MLDKCLFKINRLLFELICCKISVVVYVTINSKYCIVTVYCCYGDAVQWHNKIICNKTSKQSSGDTSKTLFDSKNAAMVKRESNITINCKHLFAFGNNH